MCTASAISSPAVHLEMEYTRPKMTAPARRTFEAAVRRGASRIGSDDEAGKVILHTFLANIRTARTLNTACLVEYGSEHVLVAVNVHHAWHLYVSRVLQLCRLEHLYLRCQGIVRFFSRVPMQYTNVKGQRKGISY